MGAPIKGPTGGDDAYILFLILILLVLGFYSYSSFSA